MFEQSKELLVDDNCVFIKGSQSERDNDGSTLKMIAADVFPLKQTRNKLSRHINVLLDLGQNDESLLNTLKSVSNKNIGRCGLIIHLKSGNGMVQRIRASKIGVNASKDFIQSLRDIFGSAHVWIS